MHRHVSKPHCGGCAPHALIGFPGTEKNRSIIKTGDLQLLLCQLAKWESKQRDRWYTSAMLLLFILKKKLMYLYVSFRKTETGLITNQNENFLLYCFISNVTSAERRLLPFVFKGWAKGYILGEPFYMSQTRQNADIICCQKHMTYLIWTCVACFVLFFMVHDSQAAFTCVFSPVCNCSVWTGCELCNFPPGQFWHISQFSPAVKSWIFVE